MGQGPGLTNVAQGQIAGTESATLLITNVPMHTHPIAAEQNTIVTFANALSDGTTTNETDNGKNSLAAGGDVPNIYSEPGTGTTKNKVTGFTSTISGNTGIAGGGQPFGIRNPYLGINYSIALEGIFPSRN
ncbi:hypothetical protein [Flavobacterium sp. ANB]|uniref:phage tail protein n=1 Tax=unclassified Flavobacterium TaxID=196869 RepID=UPI00293BA82F|nr:hypothetical protein [Flavobacterium sp. ANB]